MEIEEGVPTKYPRALATLEQVLADKELFLALLQDLIAKLQDAEPPHLRPGKFRVPTGNDAVAWRGGGAHTGDAWGAAVIVYRRCCCWNCSRAACFAVSWGAVDAAQPTINQPIAHGVATLLLHCIHPPTH